MSTITKPNLSGPITARDWDDLEAYYIQSIDTIHIPEDPKPSDILSINSRLESLFHEARLDQYYVTRTFKRAEDGYRKLKRALYGITKSGKNQEERDSMMQEHLMVTTLDVLPPNVVSVLKLPPVKITIYEMYDTYQDRMDFMKAMLDLISDKTSRLITDSGAMKIESSLGR